jgi:hypothetical protein
MPNTLSVRSIRQEDIADYLHGGASKVATNGVVLPTFSRTTQRAADKQQRHARPQHAASVASRTIHVAPTRPQLVPQIVPTPKGRRTPLVVRANRALRTVLVALCGVAILGYGLDVASSHDVGKLQDQARRLNEQNSELSAQLLKAISYQGIQENVLGKFGLHTAEHVIVVKEAPPPKVPVFKPNKHGLPVMAGF